jgi:gamma-glutamyltranspeptidase/glutathione hydrolase
LQQSDEGKSVFFKKDGSFYEAGETLRQLDLGHSLAQIQTGGADAFYRGPIAREFAADMKAHGGFITADDLAAYKAVEREPLVGTYRGLKIATVPPASAGGITVLETLNILEHFDLASDGAGSAAALHLISEGLKLSAADRALIGDTDFVKVPLDVLASKAYAAKQAERIDIHRAMSTADLKSGEIAPVESPDTTQISVVDGEGNAVSNTFTLDNDFGSGVAVDGAGFLLNNGMTLFSNAAAARAQHDGLAQPANAMAPGKRMTSSISPVMVFKNGKPWLVTGSPGGNTIPGTVVQIVVDVVDFGLNVSEAAHAPRIHQGLSDVLELEPNFNPDTRALLAGLGHTLKTGETMGSVQSILIGDGLLSGAADPRRPGALAAPANGIE